MEQSHKIYVIILFAVSCFFGLFHLTESPSLVYDEGWYLQTAANLATEGVDGLQMRPASVDHISTFVTVGYPLIYPLALWFKIFSVGVFQGRFFMFLTIIGLAVVSYLFVRKIHGKNIALAVLALLVTFPPLYGNGKSVMGEVPGLLYLAAFLLCFTRVKSDPGRRIFWIILSGLLAGLCVATKPIYILLLPAFLIGAIIEWKRHSMSPKEIGIGSASFFVPLLVWFVVQFRLGDSLGEVLTYYANPYSLTNIFDVIVGNINKLFTDVGTLYTVGLISVWFAALVVRLKAKTKIATEEIIGFIFSVLIVAAFLRTAGYYRYLFPAQIVALLFFPYSASYLSEIISRKFSGWNSKKMFAVLVITLSILGVYQLGFDSWVADTYSSKKTAYWQEYFRNVPDSTSFFFYHCPEVVPFIQSRNYYQYLILFDRSLGGDGLSALRSGAVDKVVVPTNLFQQNAGGIFDRYAEEEKAYKYSILRKR